jgi:hypothetical protein
VARFVLTDHSICDLAGHHLEYAIHVLRAAERAGFEPILVTNRKFKQANAVSYRVIPLYRFGFWPESDVVRLLGSGLRTGRRFRSIWFGLKCRLRYSTLGLAWLSRNQWHVHARRLPAGLPALSLIFSAKVLRTLILVLLIPVGLVVTLLCAVWALLQWLSSDPRILPAAPRKYMRALLREGKTYWEFARVLWRMLKPARGWPGRVLSRFQERRQAASFEKDTGVLLKQLQLDADDVLFFPTISARDTYGLAKSMKGQPESGQPAVHLLFRRNLYAGPRQSYRKDEKAASLMRQTFEAAKRCPGSAKFRFYTDTDELSYQHNTLGMFRFDTVPIPHTYSPRDRHSDSGPVRITYLGDARREKGFHFLPQLVATLAHDYLEAGKARFVVQCNYNIPGGEPEAAIARGELEAWPPPAVTLFKEPLTSEEYKDLLLSADINLLLYDRGNYYARSSGILIESLAAGIPVIVPANTWLSRQFLGRFYSHLEELGQTQPIVSSLTGDMLEWHRQHPAGSASGAREWCCLESPERATHVLLRAEFGGSTNEAELQLGHAGLADSLFETSPSALLEADGRGRCAWLLGLAEAHRLKLSVRCNTTDGSFPFRALRCDFLELSRDHSVATGAVGQMYQREDEIPELVRNMIDNYAHYRKTAIAFAVEIRSYHNPDRLVSALLETASIQPENFGAAATA